MMDCGNHINVLKIWRPSIPDLSESQGFQQVIKLTVEPIFTRADPSAVETAPNPMDVLLALPRGLPSGLVPSDKKR